VSLQLEPDLAGIPSLRSQQQQAELPVRSGSVRLKLDYFDFLTARKAP